MNADSDLSDGVWLDKVSCVAVVGRPRSGKTALVYHILSQINGRPKYILRHPKPHLIKPLGFTQSHSLEDLESLQDSIYWIDEPQLYIPTYDKRANDALKKLLTIAMQRNVCLVLSTNDTRFITRNLEESITAWLLKDIEIGLVKQGSLIKKIIRQNTMIDPDGFKLENNEFIFYSKLFPDYNGKHIFALPQFFTEAHSRPFYNGKQTKEKKITQTEIKEIMQQEGVI